MGVAPAVVLALSRAGLHSVGDLAARPAATLAARFGAVPMRQLRRLLGQEDARIVSLHPPAACVAERHFLEPLVQLQALEGVLAALVAEVAGAPERRGLGDRAFAASLFRSDGQVRRLLVETGRPPRDAAALMRLFALRIAGLTSHQRSWSIW